MKNILKITICSSVLALAFGASAMAMPRDQADMQPANDHQRMVNNCSVYISKDKSWYGPCLFSAGTGGSFALYGGENPQDYLVEGSVYSIRVRVTSKGKGNSYYQPEMDGAEKALGVVTRGTGKNSACWFGSKGLKICAK